MTLDGLIEQLAGLGVRLDVRLVVDAPRGVLTPELRDALASHKELLLQRLVQELVWKDLAGQRWGPSIEHEEPGIIVDTPDAHRMQAALAAADRDDPYAVEERAALRDEATH